MKKLILIVLFFISTCEYCPAQNNPQPLTLVWSPNPPQENVTHYTVYLWQGSDTTNAQIEYVATVFHPDTIYHFDMTEDWVKAGVSASNVNGTSGIACTLIHNYNEFLIPSDPECGSILRRKY